MSQKFKLALLALAISLGSGGAMAANDPAMICDTHAGSPEDLDLPKGVEGTAFGSIDPSEEIEAACLAASEAKPAERRFFTHLGRLYAKRGEIPKAVEAYRKAHGRGSAVAANNLGAMYMRGDGVRASEERATQLIRSAAHRGLVYAMGRMAVRAREGRGMPESQTLAFYWYEKAHEAGDVVATSDLGVMYQNGYGVRENDKRALSLFSEALARDPQAGMAAYNIASAYEVGEGVEADLGWARGYYITAFEAGFADAASDLGRFHAEGLGTPVDPETAARWFKKGADQGSYIAMTELADAYFEGSGVEQNVVEARSLYRAALDLDPEDDWRAYIRERLDAALDFDALGSVD